jgi:NAD(P)-dependent dehydrogenase (short-subunit alcohol dehydrogenase family)
MNHLKKPQFKRNTFVDYQMNVSDPLELAANDAAFGECAASDSAAHPDDDVDKFTTTEYLTACRVLRALARRPAAMFVHCNDVAELRDLVVQLQIHVFRDQFQSQITQHANALKLSVATKSVLKASTVSLDVVVRRAERRLECLVQSLRQISLPRNVLRSYVHTESRSIAFLHRLATNGRLPAASRLQLVGPQGSSVLDNVEDIGFDFDELAREEHEILDSRDASDRDNDAPIVPAELLVDRDAPYSCSQCRHTYFDVSPHYAHCCSACVDRNLMYRQMRCRLDGHVVLLTGARTKIGFATGVLLLNAGATVVATSRFPFTAARRFAEHADAAQWQTRLRVLGADFRDTATVELLCAFVAERLPHLDHLINNAAQTIRKPPAAFSMLVQKEIELAASSDSSASEFERHATAFHRQFVEFCERQRSDVGINGGALIGRIDRGALHRSALATQAHVCASDSTATVIASDDKSRSWSVPPFATNGVLVDHDVDDITTFHTALKNVAKKSKTKADDDNDVDDKVNGVVSATKTSSQMQSLVSLVSDQSILVPFPLSLPSREIIADKTLHTPSLAMRDAARLAKEGDEPLDMRAENSWFKRLENVELGEWMEVLTVNSAVPSLMCSLLLPLLRRSPLRERHVVNVSSMEGKMARRKLSAHPHTNAAKAALNMVTRTCALDWSRDYCVLMNSVDTGWVTDERPLAAQLVHPAAYPAELDEIDGAARVLQPIWRSAASDACEIKSNDCCWAHRLPWQPFGNFLKNYAPTLW